MSLQPEFQTKRHVSPRRQRARQLWRLLHRWLGLTVGAVLVAVGLTGTLFVFHRELAELLEPQLRRVDPSPEATYLPWPRLIARANLASPPGASLKSITGPEHPTAVARFNFSAPPDSQIPSVTLCLDPYTGQILGTSRLSKHPVWIFCGFLFDLHYSLQIPQVGDTLVGLAAILGLVSIASGLFLWWPARGRWRSALTVHRPGGWIRRQLDWHRLVGVLSFGFLGVLLISGIWMNFNEPFVALVQWVSPGTRESSEPESRPIPGQPPLSADQILARVQERFPQGRLNWMQAPGGSNETYTVSQLNVSKERFTTWSERISWWDAYSGELRQVQSPETRKTSGDTFLDWQWPLHSGRAFGWFGRLVVALTGLVPLILFLTGLRLWRHQQRIAQARAKAPP